MKLNLTASLISIFFFSSLTSGEKDDDTRTATKKCVTLSKYANMRSCTGKMEKVTFTVSSEPGSNQQCYHDDSMYSMVWIPYSVKDQFCSADYFHQLLYFGSDDCVDDSFWVYPTPQVFTKTDCFYGFQFEACDDGPCEDDEEKPSNDEDTKAAIE